MKRVAIFQSDMRTGGIQRSLHNLLSLIADDEGFRDVYADVFLFDERDAAYSIPESDRIEVHYLSRLPYLTRLLPFSLVKGIYNDRWTDKLFQFEMLPTEKDNQISINMIKYDLAVDFNSYWNECAICTLNMPAKRKVCLVHNNVEVKLREEWKYRLLHFFFKSKYSRYDELIMVSKALEKPFYRVNKNAVKSFRVINNPIDLKEIEKSLDEKPAAEIDSGDEYINLMAMGRLCHQKGYDLLLEDFSRALLLNERLRLYIIGDGPDRLKIENLSKGLGISDRVTFLGELKNPFSVLSLADAFVMHSRYEGGPLSFLEAKALGLPVIIPEYLTENTWGIYGSKDMSQAMANISKRSISHRIEDYLTDYNNEIVKRLLALIGD